MLVKLNSNDFTPKPGIDTDLAALYAGWLTELGIAAVELSGGTFYTFHTVRGEIPLNEMARGLPWWMRPMAKTIFKRHIDPCRFQEFYHLPAVEKIKPVLKDIPLILVGCFRRLAEMEKVLSEGKLTFSL